MLTVWDRAANNDAPLSRRYLPCPSPPHACRYWVAAHPRNSLTRAQALRLARCVRMLGLPVEYLQSMLQHMAWLVEALGRGKTAWPGRSPVPYCLQHGNHTLPRQWCSMSNTQHL